ncbi:hypothetical protein LJB98_01450 [Bacteroidales bacterium OttesenSCG-928-M11]|nr:hypothetical protein [Bacteroidales bacterium OttesenSCG-928-M11]
MVENFTEEEKDVFFSRILQLSVIYKRAKHLMLLSEYYNSKRGIVVTTMNELRGALDHIMRSLSDKTKLEPELFKAEGHLYRAIYDACEVIILDRLQYIEEFKNSVSFSSLEEAYPEYYTKTLPYLTKIKRDLVDTRETQLTKERIDKYENTVSELIEICDELDKITLKIIPREKKISYVFPGLLGASAIIFALLNMFWNNGIAFVEILISLLTPSIILYLYLFYKKRKRRKNGGN